MTVGRFEYGLDTETDTVPSHSSILVASLRFPTSSLFMYSDLVKPTTRETGKTAGTTVIVVDDANLQLDDEG